MRMIRAFVANNLQIVVVILAIAASSGSATAQPFPFDWGRAGEAPWESEAVSGGGRIAGSGVLLVHLNVEPGCTVEVIDSVAKPPVCAGAIPWLATLVSDDDPDFSETLAFGTDGVPPANPDLARITAIRFTVDY